MANVYTNTANIGGNYTGTVTVSGPVLMGQNITSDSTSNPVVITGSGTSASNDAPFSFVGGQYARSNSSLSFVWNGSKYPDGDSTKTPQYTEANPYIGDKSGTFSINPSGNLEGVFIGTKSLNAHMKELSGFVADTLSSSSIANNIVHKDGHETISGTKTFSSSLTIGSLHSNSVVINNSSIHINTTNNGGLYFHYNENSTPTATLTETSSGELTVDSKLKVVNNSTFNSTSNTFNGILLSNGKTASFVNGNVYVATQDANNKSNLAASTQYVANAISNLQDDAVLGYDGTYTGKNTFTNKTTFTGETTFANTISLSSKNNANFVSGNLYVADQAGTNSSTLAANTKFVKNIVASLSASLRGNKNAIGSNVVPIYLTGNSSQNASLVPSTANVGSESRHIYLKGGSLTQSTVSIGDLNRPVYLNNGTIAPCNEFVSTSTEQDIYGIKTFTQPPWMLTNPRVYSNSTKGDSSSYGKWIEIDFACSSLIHNNSVHYSSNRVGLVGTYIESSNKYTRTYMSAYVNKMGVATNAQLGVQISPDGKQHYAYAPQPTDANGSLYTSTSYDLSIIPTMGWANRYLARKDIAVEFAKTVTVKGNFNVNDWIGLYCTDSLNKSSTHLGLVKTWIRSDNYAHTYMAAYVNNANDKATNTSIGVVISPDGKSHYAYAPKPTDANGNLNNTADNNSTIIPTMGWVNTYFARTDHVVEFKKAVTIDGDIRAYGAVELYSNTSPCIDFYYGNNTVDYTSRIFADNGRIRMIPCASSLAGKESDTAASIQLGAQTIGSSLKPVYLYNGIITQCNEPVTTTTAQDISGDKRFTQYPWIVASPKIYSNCAKGNSNSYGKYLELSFVCSSIHDNNTHYSSNRVGLVGTHIDTSNKFTDTYIVSYANKMGVATNAQLVVRISPDGKEKYAFAPQPTDANGNIYTSTDYNASVIPTIGWANRYFARKDGAEFTGNVTVKGYFNVNNQIGLYCTSSLNKSSTQLGLVQTWIRSSDNYAYTHMVAYANNANNTATNTTIGVMISPDGKAHYAYAPKPTDANGNLYNTTDTNTTIIPTMGWVNTYFARKDTAVEFAKNVTVKGNFTATMNASLGSDAQLVRNGHSTMWMYGRDGALIRNGLSEFKSTLYYPVISAKSEKGSWDIGTYTDNKLYLSYISDERYNSGPSANGTDGQIIIGTGVTRTLTEMPLGFASFKGPITGIKGSLRFGDIPYVGGTPKHVKITVINCGNTACHASVGAIDKDIPAYSSSSVIYNYVSSDEKKMYLENASLSVNVIVY